MKIDKVEVENYRLLKKFELDLREELSLIVGKNNTGKTSVMSIMDCFLNSSSEPKFSWNDFSVNFQKKFYRNVKEYKPDLDSTSYAAEGIKMSLFISYNEDDSYANLQKFMMDLDPENNIVILEFYYVCTEDNMRTLHTELINRKIDNFTDFSKLMMKDSKKYFKFSVYSRKWDSENKKKSNETSDNIRLSEVRKLIRFESIKASREASNKENDHSLSNLSYKYFDLKNNIKENDFDDFEEAVMKTDGKLDEVYEAIFKNVIGTVNKFGGHTDDTSISIESTINELDLLKNNTTLFYEYDGTNLPENHNGLGYLNLIGIIFEVETILASFQERENKQKADINILFIEEPEAHTHPQLQYVFIKNIKDLVQSRSNEYELNIQALLTTHSSHILSSCEDFNDIKYLKLENGSINAKNMEQLEVEYKDEKIKIEANEEEKDESQSIEVYKFIKQYLTLNSSELFFADKAIIVEGDTERILMPSILKKYDLKFSEENSLPLLSQNITILSIGAHAYLFKPLFDFLGIKVLIITDIDGVKGTNRKKCPSDVAEYTSNNTLKILLDLNRESKHFEELSLLGDKEKEIDNTRLAYQIKNNDYLPRSFEDAFLQENFDFVNSNKDKFIEGLKNKSEFDKNPDNYYWLAEKCIGKKSAFATEILLNDNTTNDAWRVPRYIEEGLTWLKAD